MKKFKIKSTYKGQYVIFSIEAMNEEDAVKKFKETLAGAYGSKIAKKHTVEIVK